VKAWLWLGLVLVFSVSRYSNAAELKEVEDLFLSGNYQACVQQAGEMVRHRPASEDWQILLSQGLLATGQYPEAYQAITNALEENSWSMRLEWQARQVFLCNGLTEAAAEMTDRIVQRINGQSSSFRDAETLVVVGQAALMKGLDPKRVLDGIFEPARKADPTSRDTYLAIGNLALEKHDFALAAKRFQEGLKQLPDDPDLRCGLARAYAPSDGSLMAEALDKALERNSNHVGSLLLLADRSIDAEEYAETGRLLDRIKTINPSEPDAWAYRAVLAHLKHQPEEEAQARLKGLKFWTNNPRVDFLIGQKLSQNYRFTEGSAHQRQALTFDPDYLPAKGQLSQDLLRLGEEAEGWKLAEEVQKQDGYDVEMFNLTTLHDNMARFASLTNRDFVVRMGAHEAGVYGAQVLDLLERARTNLCAKYGFEVQRPTFVEIFPEQKDFAVRTFGMPGNPGYLGVCFGTLITANSPAATPGHPVNWQAVLWHEFCHVVTLQLTRNKMPRWLSEGISVYEEMQNNPTWGQRMTPRYREMVMAGELTPVSKLSGAFLMPPTPMHLQFAYYESCLVVEFIVQKYGLDHLKAILTDLGAGKEINEAIAAHTIAMEDLEKEFSAFMHQRALDLAPRLDWEKPDLEDLMDGKGLAKDSATTNSSAPDLSSDSKADAPGTKNLSRSASGNLSQWIQAHPTNYYALIQKAKMLLNRHDYELAKEPLNKLLDLYPSQTGSDSAYAMVASVHRTLGETNAEREVLTRFAQQDDEAYEAYLRLAELATGSGDWPTVVLNAQRSIAVNPLVATPYQFLANASKHLDNLEQSIVANRALVQLDPPNAAEVHFELGQALYRAGDPDAKRNVLQALEEAPRYRAALALLLKMEEPATAPQPGTPVREGAP
jgi:tetratricopeptide (TPR) repeat protein